MNEDQNREVSSPGLHDEQRAAAAAAPTNPEAYARIPHDGELSADQSTQVAQPAAPQPSPAPQPAAAAQPTQAVSASAAATPEAAPPEATAPAAQPAGFFHDDKQQSAAAPGPEAAAPARATPKPATSVQWVAGDNEPHHTKSNGWYALLVFGSLVISALVYLVTRDIVSAVVIALVCVGFGVVSVRRPQALHYSIDARGVAIGTRIYSFGQFRSFSIVEDTFGRGAVLTPLKRFMPILSVRFDAEQADKIVEALAEHLPMEAHRADAMDKIARTIRF